MKKTRPIRGIVPVVLTPLTKDENVDVDGLRRLMEFLISQKIGGLWVLGTGSEDMNLSFSKRLQAAQIICETNNGKIPLVLGAGFFAMEDILTFINETSGFEFDAYHVMPYHPLLSLERLDWFYRHIVDNCPKPLWMYTSGNWSRPITPGFVEDLKEHPNIAGIKFSSKDAVAVTKVASLADENFQVITAVAAQLYACLCMGSKAHTSSLGSCLPEVLIGIYDFFIEGRHAESLAEQLKLNNFLSELARNTKKDNFLQAADEKFILSLRGICEEHVSSYYRNINSEEKKRINDLIKSFSVFKSEK